MHGSSVAETDSSAGGDADVMGRSATVRTEVEPSIDLYISRIEPLAGSLLCCPLSTVHSAPLSLTSTTTNKHTCCLAYASCDILPLALARRSVHLLLVVRLFPSPCSPPLPPPDRRPCLQLQPPPQPYNLSRPPMRVALSLSVVSYSARTRVTERSLTSRPILHCSAPHTAGTQTVPLTRAHYACGPLIAQSRRRYSSPRCVPHSSTARK